MLILWFFLQENTLDIYLKGGNRYVTRKTKSHRTIKRKFFEASHFDIDTSFWDDKSTTIYIKMFKQVCIIVKDYTYGYYN